MKNLILITSLCLLSVGCNRDPNYNNYSNRRYSTDTNTRDNDQNSDWQITTRVKSAIMSDSKLTTSGRFVSVETNDGVVTLTGNVRSQDEFDSIERKVRSIKGVRKVDNQLTINP